MRDSVSEAWFGGHQSLGDLPLRDVVTRLRDLGDETDADELAATAAAGDVDTFGVGDAVRGLFNRYVKTTHVCGYLADSGPDTIVPVSGTPSDATLVGRPLKITLDALHVARYPGRGRHAILFDFAVQGQAQAAGGGDGSGGGGDQVLHFNARFEAADGETVPVRNFPLFLGLTPSPDGITFGFQTVNVSSSFDSGLLDFLDSSEFKAGLSLVAATPLLGQISGMATGLTRWLAGQSKNVKVQEFRQGLDFATSRFGAGLASGTYVVAQIPVEYERDWSWSDWTVDPDVLRLVARGAPAAPLDFNHLMFGVRPMG